MGKNNDNIYFDEDESAIDKWNEPEDGVLEKDGNFVNDIGFLDDEISNCEGEEIEEDEDEVVEEEIDCLNEVEGSFNCENLDSPNPTQFTFSLFIFNF